MFCTWSSVGWSVEQIVAEDCKESVRWILYFLFRSLGWSRSDYVRVVELGVSCPRGQVRGEPNS